MFDTFLERDSPNAAREAQEFELSIAKQYTDGQKYRINIGHKVAALRKENTSGILEVNKNGEYIFFQVKIGEKMSILKKNWGRYELKVAKNCQKINFFLLKKMRVAKQILCLKIPKNAK